MKSVTLKNPYTGEKIVKISHTSKGYFIEYIEHEPVDCLIVTRENERITIPAKGVKRK